MAQHKLKGAKPAGIACGKEGDASVTQGQWAQVTVWKT